MPTDPQQRVEDNRGVIVKGMHGFIEHHECYQEFLDIGKGGWILVCPLLDLRFQPLLPEGTVGSIQKVNSAARFLRERGGASTAVAFSSRGSSSPTNTRHARSKCGSPGRFRKLSSASSGDKEANAGQEASRRDLGSGEGDEGAAGGFIVSGEWMKASRKTGCREHKTYNIKFHAPLRFIRIVASLFLMAMSSSSVMLSSHVRSPSPPVPL